MSTETKKPETKKANKKSTKVKSYKFEDIEYTADTRDNELHLVAKKGLFTEALVKHKMVKKYEEIEAFKAQWATHSLEQVERYMGEKNYDKSMGEEIYVHQHDLHESSLIGVFKDEDGEIFVKYTEEVHKRDLQKPLGGLQACTIKWMDEDDKEDK